MHVLTASLLSTGFVFLQLSTVWFIRSEGSGNSQFLPHLSAYNMSELNAVIAFAFLLVGFLFLIRLVQQNPTKVIEN